MAKMKYMQLCFYLFLMSLSAWSAVDTTAIQDLYTKLSESNIQPDSAGLQVIDGFWRKSLDLMLLTEDTAEVVTMRRDLEKFKGEKALSYYTSAYLKAGQAHIKGALETVDKWEENVKKINAERNLLILIANLGTIQMSDIAIGKLAADDPMVRYWAVRALTSEAIISQLKSDVTRDEKLTAAIISALDGYIQSGSDAMSLPFVAQFASGVNTAASRKLLQTLADRRIDAYMKWTVMNEAVDARILKSMSEVMLAVSDSQEKQELLSRFGQWYSCVLQRYILGTNLPQTSKDQLITVIAEVEEAFVSKQIPGWVSKFRVAISKNQPLDKDFEFLFGAAGRAGELAGKLNFNYGKDDAGKVLISPRPLPSPPAAKTPLAAEGKPEAVTQP